MSKVSSNRMVELVGLRDSRVESVPIVCVRKNCIRPAMRRESRPIRRGKVKVLGMVSQPTICKSKVAPYVSAWCHPFRDPDIYIPKEIPKILLSESDFVDPMYIQVDKKRKPRWDFFYFTMGGPKSGPRKGVPLLVKILPNLCGKKNLKGVVINYTSKPLYLDRDESKIWKRYSDNVTYRHERLTAKEVAELMSQCRFGLFPNDRDCSPLLLTECLVRDIPILVNRDILGGWKYVNNDSGCLFSVDDINEPIDQMLDSRFSPRDKFLSQYGFCKSSVRLAEFGRQHFDEFKDFEKVCFSGLGRLLDAC